MLLRHDDRDNLGHYDGDWLPGYMARHRAEVIEDDRAKHVVRGPRNVSACNSQREPGHTILRERLIAHLAQATARGELAWLNMASECRKRPSWLAVEADAGMLDEEDDGGYAGGEEEEDFEADDLGEA